jgi:hypothetical protein
MFILAPNLKDDDDASINYTEIKGQYLLKSLKFLQK